MKPKPSLHEKRINGSFPVEEQKENNSKSWHDVGKKKKLIIIIIIIFMSAQWVFMSDVSHLFSFLFTVGNVLLTGNFHLFLMKTNNNMELSLGWKPHEHDLNTPSCMSSTKGYCSLENLFHADFVMTEASVVTSGFFFREWRLRGCLLRWKECSRMTLLWPVASEVDVESGQLQETWDS